MTARRSRRASNKRGTPGPSTEAAEAAPAPKYDELYEELQIHQLELEQQNAALVEAQIETEEALHRYTDLFDLAPNGYLTLDRRGCIVEANLAAALLLCTERGALLGKPVTQFITPGSQDTLHRFRRQISSAAPSRSCRVELKRDGGPPCYCQLDGLLCETPERNGAHLRLALSDVSEQTQYAANLRSLANQANTAEQHERHRIAVVLHEEVAQCLALMKWKLAGLLDLGQDRVADSLVGEMSGLCDRALRACRSLTYELSPPPLFELGLKAALAWLVEESGKQHTAKMTLGECADLGHVSDDLRILLFQSARELLHNAVKHGRADNITLTVTSKKNRVYLTVMDDGVGIATTEDTGPTQISRGFGLFSIRQRLDALGGALTIGPRPGGGTRVVLEVPLAVE